MATVYDIPPAMLNKEITRELKKIDELKPPAWSYFVKTGVFREKSPTNPDWWYRRLASLLRKVYTNGPIGVNRLRVKYGGRQSKGNRREHFKKGSGKIIRYGLQQLEAAGFVEQLSDHSGRILSPKGRSFMDKTANSIFKKIRKD